MQMVDNWKAAWRWFSVQALAALVALPVVWASLPEDTKAMMPDGWAKWIMFAIAVGGLVGRLTNQPGVPK